MIVTFQGKKGAYSELATYAYFSQLEGITVEPQGLELSEYVIESLLKEQASHAILPVENSIAGNVGVNLDLLYHQDISIVGEYYLPIQHHLLALPSSHLSDIKSVYSHPVALAQCRDFLNQHQINSVGHFDTAGACEFIGLEKKKDWAAIGSIKCAEYYGLKIISDKVQKISQNITRFVVLHKGSAKDDRPEFNKASIAFTTGHQPGALLECLAVFKQFNINLSKLESRPIPQNPFQYFFLADLIRDQRQTDLDGFYKSLNEKAQDVKILGRYKAHDRPNA